MSALSSFFGGLGGGDSVGGAVTSVVGDAADAVADSGLNGIATWILNGTKSALEEVAHLISETTAPNLTGSWFSSTYWRVAGLAALLTVPFIFAAMIQAILRSDLALIGKVMFAYLPVSLLCVSLAAPVTMLLLAATDQMCTAISSAAVDGGAQFLDHTAVIAGELSAVDGSTFFAAVVGLFTVAAALMLALELLVREAAVYVVVLMLPLAFAAFVWPARRIWAIRLVELLISLVLAKFVIVAVLSLAGSAFESNGGVSQLLTAMALLLFSTFAPWTLMRILPFTELAAGAAGALRHELPHAAGGALSMAGSGAAGAEAAGSATSDALGDMALSLPQMLRRQADDAGQTSPAPYDQESVVEAQAGEAQAPDTPTQTSQAPTSQAPSPQAPTPGRPERDPGEQETQTHPTTHLDHALQFNAGPGGWWKSGSKADSGSEAGSESEDEQ